MTFDFHFMPPSASSAAPRVDALFFALLGLTVFFTFLIAFLIGYFAIRYRRRPGHATQPTGSPLWVELTWSGIPLLIVLGIFVWASSLYVRLSAPPSDAMEIHVIGKQWMWKVQHPEGRREIDELHVPLGRPVKLVMSSQDVIHSFFIPAFRVKQDVLPGRFSMQWFTPTKLGEYHLFCAEYCGTDHAHMTGRVVVMPPQEYARWLAEAAADESPVTHGRQVFIQYGCAQCHGERAPTMAGLYQSRVTLSDGRSVLADENYLRESIVNPHAKIVAGYGPIMPTFRGQLSEEQIVALVEYIKSLQHAKEPAP